MRGRWRIEASTAVPALEHQIVAACMSASSWPSNVPVQMADASQRSQAAIQGSWSCACQRSAIARSGPRQMATSPSESETTRAGSAKSAGSDVRPQCCSHRATNPARGTAHRLRRWRASQRDAGDEDPTSAGIRDAAYRQTYRGVVETIQADSSVRLRSSETGRRAVRETPCRCQHDPSVSLCGPSHVEDSRAIDRLAQTSAQTLRMFTHRAKTRMSPSSS